MVRYKDWSKFDDTGTALVDGECQAVGHPFAGTELDPARKNAARRLVLRVIADRWPNGLLRDVWVRDIHEEVERWCADQRIPRAHWPSVSTIYRARRYNNRSGG